MASVPYLEKKLGVIVVDITKTKQECTWSTYIKASGNLTELKLTEMLVQEKGRPAGPS